MPDKPFPIWRSALDIVVNSVSAEHFREDLAWLREECGDDPDDIGASYAGLLIDLFVESTGLFAALESPREKVSAALAEIRETLAHLDFEKERVHLERNERRYYDRFAQMATPLFTELGEAMETLLNCYVAGNYDPEANPNDLIAEALDIAEEDLAPARHLITQAGAIALHSHPLWWRWPVEAYGLAAPWLNTIFNLVTDYTGDGQNPLGPPEEARMDAEVTIREVNEAIREMEVEEPEPTAAAISPVDDLIEGLIEQGETRFTPEQLALCQTHREEAIPALIDLVADEYLQLEDSPGEGYAPIRAAQLLGELRAAESIPALIDIVADTDPIAIIYSTAIHALEEIGPPTLEPLLDFLRYSRDVETKTALAGPVTKAAPDDERVHKALLELWEEATWEEGKSLLAHPLALTSGEQAIPLLEAALENPDLDWVDHNEVAAALEELGIEVPPASTALSLSDMFDTESLARSILLETSDPAHLVPFADALPEDWRSHPDSLAHAYADIERERLSNMIAVMAIILPSEVSVPLIADLLETAETLTFDASTQDYPRWLRRTYNHLTECAGLDLQLHLIGILVSLQHYLNDDYDIADDPDRLLAAARELSPDDEKLQHLFGQAGALTLHGRPFWPRWPAETDRPLSGWLEGLVEFRHPLERVGQIPLRPSPEMEPGELSATLMETLIEEEEPDPSVAELLDLLIAQKQDSLLPAQRRRFVRQRANVTPHLIRMVQDKRYWSEDGPGEGWAAILAVRLLGELKAIQSAETLVNAVADSRPEDIIHDAALFSLMLIGRLALSAVQAYFRYGRDMETKTSLAEALGRAGRQRPDTFGLLRQVWEDADWRQNRRTVALAFGDLRDRRAIPLLQAALKDRAADALDLEYTRWALQRLGTPAPPKKKSSRLKTPAPYNPRLMYDEFDNPHRLRYNAWGQPLCPDCNKPLVQDKSGTWTHPPGPAPSHSSAFGKKRRKRRRKRQ